MKVGEKLNKFKRDVLDGFEKGTMALRGIHYILEGEHKKKEEERIERKYVTLPRRK